MASTKEPRGCPDDPAVARAVTDRMSEPQYPCLGARSVFKRQCAPVRVYNRLGNASSASRMLSELREFADVARLDHGLVSFVAVFREPEIVDECQFEDLLWAQLQAIHEVDDRQWNPAVSSDVTDPHFGFSAAGTAYFVIGMHPAASRKARQVELPTLVFNLHEQFQDLRAAGHFPRLREKIRHRDAGLQGTINPMVADYGDASEARQYSGRRVGPGWKAPLIVRHDEVTNPDQART